MRKLLITSCLFAFIGILGCKEKSSQPKIERSLDSAQTNIEVEGDSASDNEEMEEVEVATGSN